MKIIKQEIQFEESLKQRLEFICEFSKIIPTFVKGRITKIKKLISHYEKFHAMLKEVYEVYKEYRTTLINFVKYKLVMFAIAKLLEMEITKPNKTKLHYICSII